MLPKSQIQQSIEMDLNCERHHFPFPECRHKLRDQVWSKPGLYPRSSEGTSSAPRVSLLFLKPLWSCFSSVEMQS